MNPIALIDIVNTGFCVIAGIYTLFKIGIFSRHVEYPVAIVFCVLAGTFGFMTNTMMAIMTVVDLPVTDFKVVWHPVQGYTFSRVLMMVSWILLLYMILHLPKNTLDAMFKKHRK